MILGFPRGGPGIPGTQKSEGLNVVWGPYYRLLIQITYYQITRTCYLLPGYQQLVDSYQQQASYLLSLMAPKGAGGYFAKAYLFQLKGRAHGAGPMGRAHGPGPDPATPRIKKWWNKEI